MKKFPLSLLMMGVVCFEASSMEQNNDGFFKKLLRKNQPQQQYTALTDIESNVLSVPVGTTIEEMHAVFNTAPKRLTDIVKHLKDPNYFNTPEYRYEFITGEPGVGKTTMAKAIGYYAGWKCIFRTATEIIGKSRNETAIKLRALFNAVINKNANSVLIIDEANELLENTENEHYDTATTAKEFWTFLDKQNGNNKFFLIGTMNRVDRLPEQIKDRIQGQLTKMALPQGSDVIRKLLLDEFSKTKFLLTEEAKTYINQNIENLRGMSYRQIKKFVLTTIRNVSENSQDNSNRYVSPCNLIEASKQIKSDREEMKCGQVPESNEEKRHKELMYKNELHYVQQNITIIKDRLERSKHEYIKRFYTPEQLQIAAQLDSDIEKMLTQQKKRFLFFDYYE